MKTNNLLKYAGIGLSIAGGLISLAQGIVDDKKLVDLVQKEVSKQLRK